MAPFWTLLLVLLVGLAAGAAVLAPSAWRWWRRHRVARRPFPAAWRAILRRKVPQVRRLPPPQQWRLKRHVQILLAEVPFIGCGGLQMTDEIRVVIAAQASLLLLGRGGSFGNLREVLVYPGHFVRQHQHQDSHGVSHEGTRVLAGESWERGQVILAWDAVQDGARDPDDGRNVVVHEFAHQIDQDTGSANGAPYVGRGAWQRQWARVMGAEFQALRHRLSAGQPGLLDPYAATDPAEFFAVCSEHFFEQPHALADAHPALFEQLQRCYRIDPRSWIA